MKVTFTTKIYHSDDALARFAAQPEIGFDADPGPASRRAQFNPDGDTGSEWVTGGGYKYYPRGGEEGSQIWEYEGPQAGFLAQKLLPPMPGAIVLVVEGTYGRFEGDNALQQYAAVKAAWEAACLPVLKILETTGVTSPGIPVSVSRFAASIWENRRVGWDDPQKLAA